MRVISLATIRRYRDQQPNHAAAYEQVLVWYQHVKHAQWSSPDDVKNDFATASILKDGRVVFNIGGNKYRLITWINYRNRIVFIKFFGTHKDYDRINADIIEHQ